MPKVISEITHLSDFVTSRCPQKVCSFLFRKVHKNFLREDFEKLDFNEKFTTSQ